MKPKKLPIGIQTFKEIRKEDVTNRGRIEFKVDTENALAQIKERNYAQKYLNDGKEIYLVGINFAKDERNICGFEWERVVSL